MGCRHFPARGRSSRSTVRQRIKILRCKPTGGTGEPGALLDDQLAIACGSGAIRVAELQRAGKQPMSAEVFLRGTALKPPLRAG